MGKRTGCSWSGGKDSCFALMQAVNEGHVASVLVNMMNENGKISRSHGLPETILQQQAAAMGVPLLATPTTWNDYEKNFVTVLNHIKNVYATEAMVFGDIDLQAHRDWEEMVCAKAELEAILPLWQQDRKALVVQMLNAGISSMIVSCNTVMGKAFLGQYLSHSIIAQLEETGVDVCGENGEFHTVVVNCPLFKVPVVLPAYTTVLHDYYWFIQWA
ncbi:MAG: diphthine--ammonia ligase [Chitinophagaceae bacterium]